MTAKTFDTDHGRIHYWISENIDIDAITLVFLPGLTADHRLFDKQIPHFEGRMNVLTWDAPGHASSKPFVLDFNLFDKARWLDAILEKENIRRPIIVGQSMGGYVGQAFAQLFPEKLCGFVSIDSAPLQRKFITAVEIWLLKHIEPVYRMYPWKTLVKAGSTGVATSEYGRSLMSGMMLDYGKSEYASLVGHGYRILAGAMEAELQYEIKCPALLICGEKDRAGSTKRYNKAWHNATGIPIEWIPGAGHNSNTDAPEIVNGIIDAFVKKFFQKSPEPVSVSASLKSYIQSEILPRYDNFDKGHQRNHAEYVISQALMLASHYSVNPDMVYAAAAFHDTGLCEDRNTHHSVSARIIREDSRLPEWFSPDEIEIIADAAEDHRASSDHEPRTIYGKLIAEADRQIIPEVVIRRTIQFGLKNYPDLDYEGHWQRTLDHLNNKYAEGGYLKLWIPESDNAARLEELRAIIRNTKKLRELFDKWMHLES